MRKLETGGALIVVVALVAIATFAYIGAVLWRSPQKAELIAEGVQEATENPTDSATDPAEKIMRDGREITDAYEAAGYPDAASLSESFRASIVAAFEKGSLNEIDRIVNENGDYAVLVGMTDDSNCYTLGEQMCVEAIIVHDAAGTRLAHIESVLKSKRYRIPNAVLLRFTEHELFFVRGFGDAGYATETGYVIDTKSLLVTEGTTYRSEGDGGPETITRGNTTLSLEITSKDQTVFPDMPSMREYTVKVSDDSGVLLTREEIIDISKTHVIDINHAVSLTEPTDNIAFSVLGHLYLYISATGKLVESTL